MEVEGPVAGFTAFHNINCPQVTPHAVYVRDTPLPGLSSVHFQH